MVYIPERLLSFDADDDSEAICPPPPTTGPAESYARGGGGGTQMHSIGRPTDALTSRPSQIEGTGEGGDGGT